MVSFLALVSPSASSRLSNTSKQPFTSAVYQEWYPIVKMLGPSKFQYPSTTFVKQYHFSSNTFPRPTVEARKELYTIAKRKAEEMRVQIRKHHSASLKRGKYEKRSIELEEVCLAFSCFLQPRSLIIIFSSKNSTTGTSKR